MPQRTIVGMNTCKTVVNTLDKQAGEEYGGGRGGGRWECWVDVTVRSAIILLKNSTSLGLSGLHVVILMFTSNYWCLQIFFWVGAFMGAECHSHLFLYLRHKGQSMNPLWLLIIVRFCQPFSESRLASRTVTASSQRGSYYKMGSSSADKK